MDLFNVYPAFEIEPIKAEGALLWDKAGTQYLDLYGGHAVISIGHTHPHFVSRIEEQLKKLAFYSNSVQNGLQKELAAKLGELSGYENHSLFLCNSGAEAIENALKLASFHTGRKKVL
ncbi:MAG: aminotransferase class III-fold pyridoxal phosphate-dependent enzyme, partial [Bacteroidota bacterium]